MAMICLFLLAQEEGDWMRLLESRYADAAKAAGRVTVQIVVDRIRDEKESFASRYTQLRSPFGRRPHTPVSGLIVDSEGWIATSYFNVSGELSSIRVTMNGEDVAAELKGYDEKLDLALLRVEREGLSTLPVAGGGLREGKQVIAAGRDPETGEISISAGIVSAVKRTHGSKIQHDAKLNFSNVGGPLLDLDGKLVGMTCDVSVENHANVGQNSGVGFAILWDHLQEVMPRLKEGEKLGGAYLGVITSDALEGGVRVDRVEKRSPAFQAGIQEGDVLLELDGEPLEGLEDLRRALLRYGAGSRILLKLLRDGEPIEAEVKLKERKGK